MLMKELNDKSASQLKLLIEELKAQLFQLRFKNATGQLEQTHKIEAVKKDIARCFSALNTKKEVKPASKKETKPVPKKEVKPASKKETKPVPKKEVKEGK